MARRPAPVGIDRRQQILEAALDLFAEHGLDGATNEEIAARAGITPGLIYFYFRSKDDLFLAAVAHQASVAFAALDFAAEAESNDPLEVVLRRVVLRFLSLMDSPHMASLMCVVAHAMAHKSQPTGKRERVHCAVRDQVLPIVAALERFLRARIARGEIPPLDTALVSQLMIGGLAAALMRQFRAENDPALTREAIVDTVLRILLDGLRGVPPARESGLAMAPGARLMSAC